MAQRDARVHGELNFRDGLLLRGGEPHRLLSGAMHYFRVPPQLWRDRLTRLRAMGLNTVETYVPWNFHEVTQGVYDFEGWRDVTRFIEDAGELGLDVIVRPGPYVCAEWDFGGLPARLALGDPRALRTSDPAFLEATDRWFDVLLPRLTPLLASAGGPIVAMQVENEYGSYGDDARYLSHLRTGLIDRGVDVLLFTSDGAEEDMLASGTVDGILATVNFGSRPIESFDDLDAFRGRVGGRDGEPRVCMEFWNGWFDHWGEPHHVRRPGEVAQRLEQMLAAGASVNFYMAHGGTNFGLTNGANLTDGRLEPTVTSYDYDAPVGEAGELTPKFWAFREVISRYAPLPAIEPPALLPRLAPQTAAPTGSVGLLATLDVFDAPVEGPVPLTMEELGQSSGLVHYRRRVTVPSQGAQLVLHELHDRATVLVDGKPAGVIDANEPGTGIRLDPAAGPVILDIFVENQGRVNYGPRLGERKGLRGVSLGQRYLHGWSSRALSLEEPDLTQRLSFSGEHAAAPAFMRAELRIDDPADGFLAMPGWGKGFLWLNGFLLGRYWNAGPQVTLYAPAPFWRSGVNELIALELEQLGSAFELRDVPDLGPVEET